MSAFNDVSPLVIYVPPELKRRLRDASWEKHQSMSAMLREALTLFLDQLEQKTA